MSKLLSFNKKYTASL